MTDVARFRIKPECLDAALEDFKAAGVEPVVVKPRDDGEISVEFHNLSDVQWHALARSFNPSHSAIVGKVGGNPFEIKH